MTSRFIFLIPVFLLLVSAQAVFAAEEARDASEFERSILHLTVTRSAPDPESPWALQNTDLSGYAGVVVGENRVLTLASLVSRAVYIQAQKVDDVEKIPMRVVFADYEANLAVLAPVDGRHLTGVKIMPVGPDLPVGSDVWLVAIESERQLQRVSLRAMEVGIREAVIGGMTVPIYSLSGQSRSACKADPIIRRGVLVGICVGISESQPQALTSGVISHFLGDKLSANLYRGFGSFGVTLSPVRSPWHRKLLGISAGKGALRVSGVNETSPFTDCLKVDDIVTGLDQVAVDHRGFYQHPQWGAVPIRHYVIAKYAGEHMTFHYTRAGKFLNCSRVLRRFSSMDNTVPGPTNEGGVPHLIFGGLMFQELSADFLSAFGRDWPRNSPPALAFIYNYMNRPSLARRRNLVLASVLGDEFNAGYEKLSNLVLKAVNGRQASSMEELKIHLRLPGIQRDGIEYAVFDFMNGSLVALPYKGLPEAQRRIAKAYAVTDASSFFTR